MPQGQSEDKDLLINHDGSDLNDEVAGDSEEGSEFSALELSSGVS